MNIHQRCPLLHSAAPEQLLGFQCTLAADLYGFGILLIELTTQQTVQRRGDWRLPLVSEDCSQVKTAAQQRIALLDCFTCH